MNNDVGTQDGQYPHGDPHMNGRRLARFLVSGALLSAGAAVLVLPESPRWEIFALLVGLFGLSCLTRAGLRRPVQRQVVAAAILVVGGILAAIVLSLLVPSVARLVYWKPHHLSHAVKLGIVLAWLAGIAALWRGALRPEADVSGT